MMNPIRGLLATTVLAILTVALVACSSIPAIPAASGPLVTVTTRGGECLDGPCGGTTVIERDGKVHQTVPVVADLGQVPGDVLTALDAAIKTADFNAIRAVQFDGECPVNFDGQEFIYETLPKIQQVNAWRLEKNLSYTIGVDGGVNLKTSGECARAGADVFVSGSALFAAHSLKQAVTKMRKIVHDQDPALADLKV